MGNFAVGTAGHYRRNIEAMAAAVDQSSRIDQHWNMPVAVWNAPSGFDMREDAERRPHHVVSLHLGGCAVEGADERGRWHRDPGRPTMFTLHPQVAGRRWVARSAIRFAHLYFTRGYAQAIGAELFGARANRDDLLRDDLMFSYDAELRAAAAAYLSRALDALEPPTVLEMDSRANLIVLGLVRSYSTIGNARRTVQPPRGLAPAQLRRAQEHIDANLGGSISVADIAAAVELSPNHFSTAFKRSVGRSPHRWLVERRIERAKALLTDRRLSVTDIALACGFGSSAHFSTAFRRETGAPPSVWRRERAG